ncbi:alpha/beta-hydrolase [Auricularia subglabra TFB-10046 SS5]|nr:alpha/beta-hydrolase [Auricularia subglabra TFB-10046 SS5]
MASPTFGEKGVADVLSLPVTATPPRIEPRKARTHRLLLSLWSVWAMLWIWRLTTGYDLSWPSTKQPQDSVYATGTFHVTKADTSALCHRGLSYAGHVGLMGDSRGSPRRTFYWFFEAQNGPETAPVILTFGGGPGTSGMFNPLVGQSHCVVAGNGSHLEPHENAWSENFNLLAIDHPIGTGFSYGTGVNNSLDAAHDVYDFLQKFYVVFPQYARNNFVVASGSYGGTYVPYVATVINEQNKLVASGHGQPGAQHIPLEALMISNPYSDYLSYTRWWLHQACYNTNLYNSTQCTEYYRGLPACQEEVQFALQYPTIQNKLKAQKTCEALFAGDRHGIQLENVKLRCDGSVENCLPQFVWIDKFFNNPENKQALGVPSDLEFVPLSTPVYLDFRRSGDLVQQPYLMYEKLLEDGIRVMHYLGMLDCNCGWPGTLSFLNLLHSPFQNDFLAAPDVPWPTKEIATVRAIGEGAGNFTLVFMAEAGHMVTRDQPALVKRIVEHWVANKPWFE